MNGCELFENIVKTVATGEKKNYNISSMPEQVWNSGKVMILYRKRCSERIHRRML